jgi:hypothetical protein
MGLLVHNQTHLELLGKEMPRVIAGKVLLGSKVVHIYFSACFSIYEWVCLCESDIAFDLVFQAVIRIWGMLRTAIIMSRPPAVTGFRKEHPVELDVIQSHGMPQEFDKQKPTNKAPRR